MPDSDTLAAVRAETDTAVAEKAELLLAVRRRELVEVDRLKSGISNHARQVRDHLMVVGPARQAAMLAAAHNNLNAGSLAAVLTATMRGVLKKISRGPTDARAE